MGGVVCEIKSITSKIFNKLETMKFYGPLVLKCDQMKFWIFHGSVFICEIK